MRSFFLIAVFYPLLLFIIPYYTEAQGNPLYTDSSKVLKKDDDTLKKTLPVHKKGKNKGPLQSKVVYNAKDSIRLDAVQRKIYLYRDASVKYEDLELKAGYIEITLDSNIAFARGIIDSGKTKEMPEFHQGSDVFYATEIRYNFKTHKGRINRVYTKEGEGYIHGEVVKKDTDNVYYMKHITYTTCSDTDDPHFYVGASKSKVIPHDKVVTGPAWMVIEGVPTPLAVPFAFFPLTMGRQSGILIPTYDESQQLGFFLQNGGYYFGLSDHMDMELRGDIYSYGSWGLKDNIDYSDRYHYQGNLAFAWADTKLPISPGEFQDQKNFILTWVNNQDPKANPYSNFKASVTAGSSNYFTYNSEDPAAFLQNTFSSNISYSKNFPESPFHIALNADHSQNTINHQVDITLPQLTFSSDQLYPAKWFEENPDLNTAKWYNNISFGLTTNASNQLLTNDIRPLNADSLAKMQNGITTSIPLAGNFKIFKYFTFTPGISYTNIDYFQTIRESWDAETQAVNTSIYRGFETANTYNASATVGTNVYSLYSLGVHKSIYIRHVLLPTVGFSYHPDYSSAYYDYYRTVQINESGTTTKYSIFQNGIYGGPGLGKAGQINLGLSNNLEMKYKVHTDSGAIYKKLTLIERFNISTSYNLAADSFQWAYVNISGNTTLFKKLGVNYSATLDPYPYNSAGGDVNQLVWAKGEGIGRITSSDLSFTTTLTGSSQNNDKDKKSAGSGLQITSPDKYFDYEQGHPEFYAPLSINQWSVTAYYNILTSNDGISKQTTQSATFNGSAQVTKFWYASIYTGYDFVGHQFTPTSISLKRDLHCWEMIFTTIPFGFHQSFMVDIHVKSSILKDLKLTRHRDWYDTQQYQ